MAETKEQALDLVAAVFTRAGARLPKAQVGSAVKAASPTGRTEPEPPDINEQGHRLLSREAA